VKELADPGYEIGWPENPDYGTDLVYGGRKTNGTAYTEPIKVIYHGPRRFVAQLETTIWDHPLSTVSDNKDADIPLVKIVFTIIFNKVKKQVIILKDIKSLLEPKYGSDLRIQFSNRGEVDLGTGTYLSNAYFWTEGTQDTIDPNDDGWPTVYDSLWELSKTDDLGLATLCSDFPQDSDPTFDVAMAINPNDDYVWWAAFWPSLSDYTIDGWHMWYRSIDENDPHDTSITAAEERTPFYIGEWDFQLDVVNATTPVHGEQFRGVTVYGVTDLHDGELTDGGDSDFADSGEAVPDSEMVYCLNETFNPMDLLKAVNKSTMRWVQKETGDGTTTTYYLEYTHMFPGSTLGPNVRYNDLVYNTPWDGYCSFAERVLVDGVLQVRGVDYSLENDTNGYAYIEFVTPPPAGSTVKILFSTYGVGGFDGAWEWLIVGRDSAAVDSAGSAMVSEFLEWNFSTPVRMSGLDMQDVEFGKAIPWILSKMRPGLDPAKECYRDDDFGPNTGRIALKGGEGACRRLSFW